jgi:elongation factor G
LKVYKSDQIRNIALGAHGGAGKTSLVEAMLFNMGEITRIGTVEQGSTVSDYNEEEIERQISLGTSLLHGEWNNHKINMVDTPGYTDFFGEVVGAFRAVDSVLVLISATGGVEVGTELAWEEAEKQKLPRIVVFNRLDKENVNFDSIFSVVQQSFGHKVVLAQLPVNVGPGFNQIIDLVRMKVFNYATDGSGNYNEENIPANLQERANELHLKLIEAVAESDDSLMEKYFAAGELSEEEFKEGLRKAILRHEVFPVFCTVATNNVGVKRLNDVVVNFLPAPIDRPAVTGKDESGNEVTRSCDITAPASALVFKTVSEAHVGELSYFRVFSGAVKTGDDLYNVDRGRTERIGQIFVLNGKNKKNMERILAGDLGAVVKLKETHTSNTLCDKSNMILFPPIEFPQPKIRTAIIPKTKGDEEKISTGLHNLHEEDPTFIAQYDPELKQTIVSGQGELHLQIILKRLKNKYHVEVIEEEPKIPYRETIRGKAEAQGKYKKQSGGRGQYGDCYLRLEKMERGKGFEFVDAIVGGVIPGKYIPAVEKGVVERMGKGVMAGFPVVDVRVTCFDGSYHAVDSSEMAFKIAGSMGFQKAFMDAKPVLLEPIVNLTVKIPDEYMGDIMGDISSRRGKIIGMDNEGRFQIINAQVPLSELHKYSTTLRSMTQGRGIHNQSFSHYEEVPAEIAEKIIAQSKKEKTEEEE